MKTPVAVDRLGAVNDKAADVRDNWLPSVGVNGRMLSALKDVRVVESRIILRGQGQYDRQGDR